MIDINGWIDRVDNLLQVQKENSLDYISASFTRRELIELKIMMEIRRDQEGTAEEFAKWVASEVFDTWEDNKDTFAEIACRKLEKLGIVRANGDHWELVEPKESEE